MKFKITVIIPYDGRERNFSLILENLYENQTRVPDEIIVVNDTLNSINIEKKYNFIEIQNKKKGNRGKSRNIGASMATGDILIFQDNDILLFPHYIELVEIIFYGFKDKRFILDGEFRDIDKWIQKLPKKLLFKYIKDNENYLFKLLDKKKAIEFINIIPEVIESRQFAIDRKLFWEIGGFDENFDGWGCEDTEFFYRANKILSITLKRCKRLYSFHLEHPIDMIKLIDDMKRNAKYFIKKHPEAKKRFYRLFEAYNVFGTNKAIERTYNFVKEIREKTNIKDFGIVDGMRYIGYWRY